ncbi:helix-turn-helix domain-containing protein [Streptomyces sp. T028]|uniref:helix-turn-helix domain-containing protein n=1 Tax=Streptomyces sp. T028 TaxID=3394379 RepID=UPI003A859774
MRLLRELAAQPRTGAAGVARPTAFRLLSSLEKNGFVDRVDHHYVLGRVLARLGRHADPHAGLVARAQPLLREPADSFDETVSLAVPESRDGLDWSPRPPDPGSSASGPST